MQELKISLITVAYNAQNTIERCIISVLRQQFLNLEYIIIDGGSKDGTVDIVEKYKDNLSFFVSEPDKGIYDAMNKGIALATGDIIGTLNADDYFADNEILNEIAGVFAKQDTDVLYGDMDYVDASGGIVRKWRSGEYRAGIFNRGWMPPHPTFYCKRGLFKELGAYSLEHGSAADYELMLRFMHLHNIKAGYLKRVMVKMVIGGVSNKNFLNRVKALNFDFKAMRQNGIAYPVITILMKPLRKVIQFF